MTAAPLLDALQADIKDAMKARDQDKLTALRTLHAQIKDATVNAGREAADADVAAVVAKAIKQRQDAAQQFQDAGRSDLADKERREIELFRKYQPQQLDAAAIEALVRACIAATGASGKKDMGKVMQALMPQVKGCADGKLVNQIVQAQLGG
jgi:uncharacterized protein